MQHGHRVPRLKGAQKEWLWEAVKDILEIHLSVSLFQKLSFLIDFAFQQQFTRHR